MESWRIEENDLHDYYNNIGFYGNDIDHKKNYYDDDENYEY